MASLMVILSDRVSTIITKGEYTPRYYNPGNLFDEVHLLVTNDDRIDWAALQYTVGNAKLSVHNLPYDDKVFYWALGYRPSLLKKWAAGGVRLAAEIKPDLIRCHGNHLNAFIASEIKRKLGIPYIISMHINPDADMRRLASWRHDWKEKFILLCTKSLEKINITGSDCVICVYRFIEPYARKYGARRVELIYNVVNQENLLWKENYKLSDPIKLIIPGRQFRQKNPAPLMQALVKIPNAELTLIGDGSLHDYLKELAKDIGIGHRCIFHKSLDNSILCRSLKDYDILVSINYYGGISKVELEAAHVGIPVVTNAHPLEAAPEILGKHCIVVDGSPESYYEGLMKLITDDQLRQNLGERLRESVKGITPEKMEKKLVALYTEFLNSK